jgi:hypothetical protein
MSIDVKSINIRIANTEEGLRGASMLINRMYTWRGYGDSHRVDDSPYRITLSAMEGSSMIGTVTLGIDSEIGLLADEVFGDQLAPMRARGARLCEISKLAFDPTVRSKEALGSLFHILYIYARHQYKCNIAVIEVNPRHRRYYEHMLGFQVACSIRSNPRVDAPAYLMWIDLDYMAEQIALLGGTASSRVTQRSLYPYFFPATDEIGIANRLFNLQ